MGASDIVPGVSGGTMAFILGIYEELIESIRRLADREFLHAVFTFKVKKVFELANWEFLVAVVAGVLAAILTLAPFLEFALSEYSVYVWSFFFGLILASVFTISRRIKKWRPTLIGLLIVGAITSYIFVGLIPAQTPNTWWFLILTGMLVAAAFILPGVSGSFILVLLGKYESILNAVTSFDIVTLGLVAIGGVLGLLLLTQILGWAFKNYHDYIVAILIGLMLGSLRKIWPWKQDIDYLRDAAGNFVLDSEGLKIVSIQYNVLPQLPEQAAEVAIALVLALVGLGAVILLERIARKEQERTKARQEAAQSDPA